ncbi:hypothetical protein B0H14DRAFT_197026 [Mycena olivaceomarginata]|nr:hypothetical protein B0H14DRAFT_197026 [Mycena olivaceomarginata]
MLRPRRQAVRPARHFWLRLSMTSLVNGLIMITSLPFIRLRSRIRFGIRPAAPIQVEDQPLSFAVGVVPLIY